MSQRIAVAFFTYTICPKKGAGTGGLVFLPSLVQHRISDFDLCSRDYLPNF